jgi:ferric-dicitrate binding protein FerR (iron transport regulator)
VEARRRRRWALGAASLAAALAAVVVTTRSWPGRGPSAPPAAVVAHLQSARGVLEAETSAGWAPLAPGEAARAGAFLRTGAGGAAAFRAAGGQSVRLDGDTRARWTAPGVLELVEGAVYVDSARAAPGPGMQVRTPRGSVREVGTQFEVRLRGDAVRVRVREGRVAVAGAAAPGVEADAGTELWLEAGGVRRGAVPVHGPDWAWVHTVVPAAEIDGRPLREFLDWAGREGGWTLRYADGDTARLAETTVLHGSVRGLGPEEAVAAVLPSVGLPYRLEDGVLRIGPAEEPGR